MGGVVMDRESRVTRPLYTRDWMCNLCGSIRPQRERAFAVTGNDSGLIDKGARCVCALCVDALTLAASRAGSLEIEP